MLSSFACYSCNGLVTTLECKRASNRCTIERKAFGRASLILDDFPADSLAGAQVIRHRGTRSLSVRSSTGRIPFVPYAYGIWGIGLGGLEHNAAAVNEFVRLSAYPDLAPSHPTLLITQDDRWSGALLGAIPFALGLLMAGGVILERRRQKRPGPLPPQSA